MKSQKSQKIIDLFDIKLPLNRKYTLRDRCKLKKNLGETFQQSVNRPQSQVRKDLQNNRFYRMKMSLMLQEISKPNPSICRTSRDKNDPESSTPSFTIKSLREKRKSQTEQMIIKYKDVISDSVLKNIPNFFN